MPENGLEEFILTRDITALGDTITSRISIVSGSGQKINEGIPGSSTDLLIALVIDVSQLKVIYLICKTAALTLEFNSASAPSKTISLVANEAFEWDSLSGHANPFASTDVTALYVTKAGAGDVVLKGFILTDPTVA